VRGVLSGVRGMAWIADDAEVLTAIERAVATISADGVDAVLRSTAGAR
jgi:hypothetical protein